MAGNIFIHGIIGIDTTIQNIVDQLATNRNESELKVIISSEGGFMTDGFAMYDLIQATGKTIHTEGYGLIASMASVLFMLGEKRSLAPNARFMIHQAVGGAHGTADEVRIKADEIEALEEQAFNIHSVKTGINIDKIREMSSFDNYISPEDAVTLGFATQVLQYSEILNQAGKAYFLAKDESKKFEMKTIDKIKNFLNGDKPKSLALNLENGATLTVVTNETEPRAGDPVNLEGQTIENGSYTTVEGLILNIEAGKISEVTAKEIEQEPPAPTETEVLQGEVTNLKEEITALNEKITALSELDEAVNLLVDHVKELARKDISNGFTNPTGSTDVGKEDKLPVAATYKPKSAAQRMAEIREKVNGKTKK